MSELELKAKYIAFSYILGYCAESLKDSYKLIEEAFEKFKSDNLELYISIFEKSEKHLIETQEEHEAIQPCVEAAFKELREEFNITDSVFSDESISNYIKLLFSPTELLQIDEEHLDKMLGLSFSSKDERYKTYRNMLVTTNVQLAQLAGEEFNLDEIKQAVDSIPDEQLASVIFLIIVSAERESEIDDLKSTPGKR